MHLSPVVSSLALTSTAWGYISLTHPPNNISSGSVQHVSWSTNESYTLQLHLVQETGDGWADIDTIFKKWHQETGEGSYDWSVPQVIGPDRYVSSSSLESTMRDPADTIFVGTLPSGSTATTLTEAKVSATPTSHNGSPSSIQDRVIVQ